jgi:hypothetical protein
MQPGIHRPRPLSEIGAGAPVHLGRIYRKLGVPDRVALVNLINSRP